MASGSPERDFGERSGDDHYVLYTGGTTGMPKGVVWRQEDVFFALGGGIDAYTNERVASEWSLAEKAKTVENPLRSLNLPPLMHGAAQWGFFRFAFEGNFVVFLRRFDPHEVWRTVEREGINTLSITGDAMARPMIEALEEMGGPECARPVVAVRAGLHRGDLLPHREGPVPRAVPEPDDHRRHRELGDRVQRHADGRQGRHAEHRRRPHRAGRPRLRRARRGLQRDRARHRPCRADWPVAATCRSSTTRTPRSRPPPSSPAPAACGTRWPATWRSTRPTAPSPSSAGARSASTPEARRSSPRRSRPPSRRTRRCSTPSSSGCPTSAGASGWPPSCSHATAPRPTLDELDGHCRGYVAGYKVPKELHLVPEVVRSPSGKPDYPWASQGRPRRDRSMTTHVVNEPNERES